MLTWDDVYHAAMQGLKEGEGVAIHNQAFYAFIADRLNESHIAPLQGEVDGLLERIKHLKALDDAIMEEDNRKITDLKELVKDYMEFSKYATPLLKRGRLEWEAESEALARRAQQLLNAKEQ